MALFDLLSEPDVVAVEDYVTRNNITIIDFKTQQLGTLRVMVLISFINRYKLIQSLHLHRKNGVPPEDIKLLGSTLRNNPNLTRIHFIFCRIGIDICSSFYIGHLTTLNLAHNNVRGRALAILSQGDSGNLTHLNLRGNGIAESDSESVSLLLTKNKDLKYLNLSYNEIGYTICQMLAPLISNLTALELSHCNLSPESIKILFSELSPESRLENVNLNSNNIFPLGLLGAVVIGQVLQSNKSIRYLSLDNCSIVDAELEIITSGLMTNYSLVHLTLNSNHITDVGLASLAKMLSHNNTLATLYLDNNNIVQLSQLAEALQTNTGLTKISFCNNNITKVEPLAEALERNRGLIYLSLGHNNIGDEGAISLADMLKTNTSLKYLSLSKTEITIVGFQHLLAGLKYNENLLKCRCLSNDDPGAVLLKQRLKINRFNAKINKLTLIDILNKKMIF